MPSSYGILIHSWPIVEMGLRGVLQSLKIDLKEICIDCPEIKKFTEWKGAVILIDTKHEDFIRKHLKFLQQRSISIVGINFDAQLPLDSSIFDELLFPTDSQSTLFSKLNKFAFINKRTKSSHQLSSREMEVLKLVATGQSNKQISEKLYISVHTVITHRKHITSKLGVKSISGLTLFAIINNLIDQP